MDSLDKFPLATVLLMYWELAQKDPKTKTLGIRKIHRLHFLSEYLLSETLARSQLKHIPSIYV